MVESGRVTKTAFAGIAKHVADGGAARDYQPIRGTPTNRPRPSYHPREVSPEQPKAAPDAPADLHIPDAKRQRQLVEQMLVLARNAGALGDPDGELFEIERGLAAWLVKREGKPAPRAAPTSTSSGKVVVNLADFEPSSSRKH
jgi:hypothetical protein